MSRSALSVVALGLAGVGVLGGVVATSCAQPYGSRHWPRSREDRPQLIFDVDADLHDPAHFWDAPWPSDARRLPTGAPDVAGLPNPYGVSFVEGSKEAVMRDVDAGGAGFSPLPVVSFRLDRVARAANGAPLRVLPLSTVTPESGVQLVDLTPGRVGTRVHVEMQVTHQRDVARPEGLLQLAPLTGLSLLPGTWAAIVRRDVDGDGAIDLNASPTITSLLTDTSSQSVSASSSSSSSSSSSGRGEAWHQAYAPLRAALPALGLRVDEIALATVFTVGDPTARLTRFMDAARHGEVPTLVSLERGRDVVNATGPSANDLVELQGVVRQAQHQAGTPPHLFSGGTFVVDDDGNLQITREEDAPFVLTIPKGKMPAEGWPLLLYVHGTGGHATQAIDRGRRARPGAEPVPGSGLAGWVAPFGVATACMAGPYSPDRIGAAALDGYGAYVFTNPAAMRDNFGQMLIEHGRFLRLLETMRIDPALAPGVDASAADDGQIRFNLQHALVGGHSLGSYLSGMLAGTYDDFDGAVLSGAGGTWVEFAFGPKDPVNLQGIIETVALPPGEDLDRFHPFIDVFEAAAAAADNTFYTRRILRHPRAGQRPPHVLVVEGQPDAQVPTLLQRALVRSVGVDFVGDDVGVASRDRLLPALHSVGRSALRGPVTANVATQDGPRTGVVLRWPEDGLLDGHSVLFQRPETRQVFVDFVRSVAAGQTPEVVPLPAPVRAPATGEEPQR